MFLRICEYRSKVPMFDVFAFIFLQRFLERIARAKICSRLIGSLWISLNKILIYLATTL